MHRIIDDVQLTMKKFLSLALVALMLCASVTVFAAAPTADKANLGNGFYSLYRDANGPGQHAVSEEPLPVTAEDTANGLKVTHGGYFQTSNNWGGVGITDKYDLDGLEMDIFFEKVPEVDTNTDCWIAVDFLTKPETFLTGGYEKEGANKGVVVLIRFGKPYLEVYNGITGFNNVYNSQDADATVNEIFAIKSGTTLTVKLSRNVETGVYTMTYVNGDNEFEVPYEFPLDTAMTDGKGHPVVMASASESEAGAFVYYIKDIRNGTEMPAETTAKIIADMEAAALQAKVDAATKEVTNADSKAAEVLAAAEAFDNEELIEAANAAVAVVDEAKAALEAEDFELVSAKANEALDLVAEADGLIKDYEKENGPAPEAKDEEPSEEEPEITEEPAEEGGFPVVPVAIAVAVIVVIAIIAVVAKKKK